ncbi:MAG: hypothetical protein R3175_15135 [Marinobacter sp.]|uniref:hypothetical protein n=1 Tax=Marinobacter sp. TaxID=50741 RepID=UPI00299EE129|nr:hypothetical protein [Marinobacter sp.]MDX1757389.1 hypothetical protein [Marinobacter sp.]
MKCLLTALIVSVLASVSHAYEGEPAKQVDRFFAELSAGKVNESIDNLYASNPAMQQKIQALTMLKQQLASLIPLYGSMLGNENVSREELSPSLMRIVQVAKHELHPVIWEFYFYKPEDKWIISQAMFVDQFQIIGAKK